MSEQPKTNTNSADRTGVLRIPMPRWSVVRCSRVRSMLLVLPLMMLNGGRAVADDCPRPLEPKQITAQPLPDGMVRRRAVEIEPTRIVFADYMRSRTSIDDVVDAGTGWMESRSDVRRRIRYQHQFPLPRRPMILVGTVAEGSTDDADIEIRVGCHQLKPEWRSHLVEGEADRLVLRVESVLGPGERVHFWWAVDLEVVVSGRLPADRDEDDDVDIVVPTIALEELGRNVPETESEGLRELMRSLGTGSSGMEAR